jgi:glycosyltransferase involved in cell wall biosynthesis
MKVAVVHNFYRGDVPSGENLTVLRQVKALRNANFQVKLISTKSDDFISSKISMFFMGLRWGLNWGKSPRSEIDLFEPDLVIVHNLYPTFNSRWLNFTRYPVVYWLHNFRLVCMAGTYFRQDKLCTKCAYSISFKSLISRCANGSLVQSLMHFLRRLLRSDKVEQNKLLMYVSISPLQENYFRKTSVRINQMSLIPNFIDNVEFSPQNHNGKWLFAGRIDRSKGILQLIANFPRDKHLDIYGSGPLREQLIGEVKSMKNMDYFDYIDNDHLIDLLPRYQGIFIPSLWVEGLPTIFLESLAVGTPVISVQGNSMNFYISTYDCGYILKSLTLDEIYKGMSTVEKRRKQFQENGRKAFEELFTEQRWIESVRQLFEKITS